MDLAILTLEKEFNDKRVALAKDYLFKQNINATVISEEDLISIYVCLKWKAEKKLKEKLRETERNLCN